MPITKETIANAKNNSVALARFFIEDYEHFVLDKNRELFIYDNGIYKEVDNKLFDEYFMGFLKKYNITETWKLNKISEVKRAVYAMGVLPIVEFDNYDNLICFKNCILNLDKMEENNLSPKYYFTTMVGVDYKADALRAENFVKFLKTVFTLKTGEPDIDTIDNIIKIGGYLLYPQNRLELMFLFLGGGSNGKSILILIFKMFFGEENISHLDLNTLSSKSLEREQLIGSRLNVTTEAKSNNVDSEMIKQIISSETIQITKKNKKAVNYTPRTKLVVASNTQPFFNDTTHGLYRRIYPITFKNRFVTNIKYKKIHNPALKRIFKLKDKKKLLAQMENEKSGVLNIFLVGLKSLRNNNWQLSMSQNSDETLSEYEKSGDSVSHFLTEFYQETPEDSENGLTLEEILQEYREWYRANVSERSLNYSAQSLGRKIKELWRVEPQRKYIGGGKRQSSYPLERKYYVDGTSDGNNAEGGVNNEKTLSQGSINFEKQQNN